MSSALSTDDLKGLPHVVLVHQGGKTQVHTFEGPDSVEKANVFAQATAMALPDAQITVAMRYRTITGPRFKPDTTHQQPRNPMGRSTKEVWQADAAGALLLYEPERLTPVTDPAHPLYDDRVHLPVDEALVRSIMRKGVMQPICGMRDPATGQVLVSAGRQRTKAAIEANRRLADEGRPTIRVPVMPRSDTMAGAMEVSASENAIRRDETPLQRAGKMRRMHECGHDLEGIAEAFGCSVATVESTMLLLSAHPAVQQALASDTITAGHAGKLLRLKPEQQAEAVAKITGAAVASATGDQARAMRGKRELRAALEGLSDYSPVRATLLWVLGEVEELPA